uniref:Transposase n=1 Tax=Macrostomum lignano TaxID=282301 RepID=A0A1I8H4S7_9PLAT
GGPAAPGQRYRKHCDLVHLSVQPRQSAMVRLSTIMADEAKFVIRRSAENIGSLKNGLDSWSYFRQCVS